jgi:MFS family permease
VDQKDREAAGTSTAASAPALGVAAVLHRALLAPIRAFRLTYLPLLMVYFAYGALGLIAVAQSFWEKKGLTLSPAELAQLGVWLALPWAIKMVFGEMVDTVAILGSRRRAYVFLGAGMVAVSLVLLAGAAGGWLTFARPDTIYIIASLMSVVGVVLQDVVADAMSTEVVPRVNPDGTPRTKAEIDYDLGMVQALGRLSLYLGILLTARLAGWLAQNYSYETVFLIGLVIPLISVSGAVLVRLEASESRPTDWRILGGGLAFGAFVVAIGVASVPYAQEIVFAVSMAVIVAMLIRVTRDLAPEVKQRIAFAAILIFAFRAVPGVGAGYSWFSMDKLGFDEEFFGRLNEISAFLGLLAAWFLSDAITRQPVARVLLWLTIAGLILAIPNFMLVYGVHQWTEPAMGLTARGIAMIDAAAQSPLVQISMIPLLTLTAIYAPPAQRATWFALMASFMNLALVAGQLQTKYLNQIFAIERGQYDNLPTLLAVVVAVGFIVPIVAILLVGRRVR